MPEIIGMTKEELINLDPLGIDRGLSEEEIVYIAKTLDSYWEYDYQAADEGKVGMHAILKSERHSDGFFVSRIMLQYPDIRAIMADQLVLRFQAENTLNQLMLPRPDWVAGIPDGATELGQDVAKALGVRTAEMKKEDGRIVLVSSIGPGEILLLIEDFCTRGTGFKEAVSDILFKQPKVKFLPYEFVIINRGGLREIKVEGFDLPFRIVAAAEHRVNDWEPAECPLCKMGSKPIKPKATEENWRLITTSQQ